MLNDRNIILTGPPRSGTTLACFLLNKVRQTYALHEPMNLKLFPDPDTGMQSIREFFDDMRTSLLTEGKALSKASGSAIPDNPFLQEKGQLRQSIVRKEWVSFPRPEDRSFFLVIKQNAHFTFLLDRLIHEFPCAAILRNPISVIASWNTIDAPVARGTLTVLETLDPAFHARLEQIPDLLDRQIVLLDAMFQRYRDTPGLTIVRYEEMIASSGQALSAIVPGALELHEPLESRNRSSIYDPEVMERIKTSVLAFRGAWLDYYPEQVLQKT